MTKKKTTKVSPTLRRAQGKKKVVKSKSKYTPKAVQQTPVAKSSIGITPLADRVVIRPASTDELATRPSGIIIPDTVEKERPSQGTVVAVGPGMHDDGVLVPMTVRVGDNVMFSKYGFDEVKVAGEEYYIVKEENILAIIG